MEENIEKTFTEAVQDKARKGKRGVVKLVFGRTAVILLLVALQAAVLVLTSLFLFKYVLYAYAGYMIIAMLIVMSILNRPGTPEMRMPWLVLILAFPVFGGLLYLFVELQPGARILNKKVIEQTERMRSITPANEDVMEEIREEDVHMAGMASYLRKV